MRQHLRPCHKDPKIGRQMMGGRFWIAAILAVMFTTHRTASAQVASPDRPVHVYVPYPAGGGVDILTRMLGDVVSKQWGQNVVVENRPGAGGVLASQALTRAAGDG